MIPSFTVPFFGKITLHATLIPFLDLFTFLRIITFTSKKIHCAFNVFLNNHPASILFCPETCSYGSCKSCPVEPLCSLGAERPEKNGTFEVGKGYNPLAVYLNASFRYTNTATSLGK